MPVRIAEVVRVLVERHGGPGAASEAGDLPDVGAGSDQEADRRVPEVVAGQLRRAVRVQRGRLLRKLQRGMSTYRLNQLRTRR